MANLVLEKNGEFWQVFDADRGVTVFSATNQGVAQAFIANNDDSIAARQRFALQDINYQGGIDTAPAPVSPTQNPQVPAVPTGQVRVFGDSNTTTTITPATTGIGEGQVRVFGDATTTDIVPATTRIGEGQVRVFGDSTTTDIPVEDTSGSLIRLNDGANLGVPDEFGFVEDPVTGIRTLPEGIPVEDNSGSLIRLNDGQNLGVPDEFGFVEDPVTGVRRLPEDIPIEDAEGYLTEVGAAGTRVLNPEQVTEAQESASAEFNARQRARQQQSIASQRKQVNNGDWRVRLRLAPQSKYLYNAPQPGILQPLTVTDGVIFPYTPTISTSYKANYSPYDLTHSNYRGYFYSSSNVEPITVTGTFTAQDTSEANYLLAVIHFFRSATKMFYGQDAERGAPPPLVYLTGLGEYQFNEHSCLIQNFTYTLPNDVDYIRAGSPGNIGTNLTTNRDRQSVATNGVFGSLNRLAAAFLTKGAIAGPPAPPTLGLNRPTYVPTKMEIAITLLPIQSRQQVSKQFSVKEFANGNLLRGGFW